MKIVFLILPFLVGSIAIASDCPRGLEGSFRWEDNSGVIKKSLDIEIKLDANCKVFEVKWTQGDTFGFSWTREVGKLKYTLDNDPKSPSELYETVAFGKKSIVETLVRIWQKEPRSFTAITTYLLLDSKTLRVTTTTYNPQFPELQDKPQVYLLEKSLP